MTRNVRFRLPRRRRGRNYGYSVLAAILVLIGAVLGITDVPMPWDQGSGGNRTGQESTTRDNRRSSDNTRADSGTRTRERADRPAQLDDGDRFTCPGAQAIDGDTLKCSDGRRIRLQGIDAPEMPGHCRTGRACTPGDPYASTDNLKRLIARGRLQCRQTDVDHYGRTVARCSASGTDLSCAQIAGGYAVQRYVAITC